MGVQVCADHLFSTTQPQEGCLTMTGNTSGCHHPDMGYCWWVEAGAVVKLHCTKWSPTPVAGLDVNGNKVEKPFCRGVWFLGHSWLHAVGR